MIDVPFHDLASIKQILAKHVPGCEVRVFGSRVNGTARSYSDLDVVIIGEDKVPRKQVYRLKEAFQESDLPFRVDVLDWHRISLEFRKIIENAYEVVQEGTNDS